MVDSLVWLVLERQDPIMKSLVTVYIRVCACGSLLMFMYFWTSTPQVPNWTQTCRGWPQGIPNVANYPAEQCQFSDVQETFVDTSQSIKHSTLPFSPKRYKQITWDSIINTNTWSVSSRRKSQSVDQACRRLPIGGWMHWKNTSRFGLVVRETAPSLI